MLIYSHAPFWLLSCMYIVPKLLVVQEYYADTAE